jgi:hypothetical protein
MRDGGAVLPEAVYRCRPSTLLSVDVVARWEKSEDNATESRFMRLVIVLLMFAALATSQLVQDPARLEVTAVEDSLS